MLHVSTSDFRFDTDAEALDYLRGVIETMMTSFGITREEALGRINVVWSPVGAVTGPEDLMYHELPVYWANHFYFGKESCWWLDEDRRQELGLPPLAPLPYRPAGRLTGLFR